MLKFKMSDLQPGEEYAVLLWQGEWHLVRVERISDTTQDLTLNWMAAGMQSLKIADDARVRRAQDARVRAEREAAGVCACGLPYDQHVTLMSEHQGGG